MLRGFGLTAFIVVGICRTSGSDIDPASRCSCRWRSFSSMRSARVGPFGRADTGAVDTGAWGWCEGGLLYVVAESDRYPELGSRRKRSGIGRVVEGACLALLDRPMEDMGGCR
jgi:hypothetical protein